MINDIPLFPLGSYHALQGTYQVIILSGGLVTGNGEALWCISCLQGKRNEYT